MTRHAKPRTVLAQAVPRFEYMGPAQRGNEHEMMLRQTTCIPASSQ